MSHKMSCSLIFVVLLVSLYSVTGYPTNVEEEVIVPEKLSGWGPPSLPVLPPLTTNGTTVTAGQTIMAGNATASVMSTDDVDIYAYDYYGGSFTANQTMNNTADNSIFTGETMEVDVDDISVVSGGAGLGHAANVVSQTVAVADGAAILTYTEQPVNSANFSAGMMGVSTWVTGSNGTNLGGSGTGWRQEN